MTTIGDVGDLARILQENPQWREIVRNILLGDELLQLPRQLAEFIQATQQNFQLVYERLERLEDDVAGLKTDVAGLKTDVAELMEGQTRLEERQITMSGQLGNLIGSDYERQAVRLSCRRLGQQMSVHHAEILYAITTPDRMDIPDLMYRATADGAISHAEADDLEESDLILRGLTAEGDAVYVLAEISVTVGRDDVYRAARRAGILERAARAPVRAAVIGESASPEGLDLASRENSAFLQVAGRQTQTAESSPSPAADAEPLT